MLLPLRNNLDVAGVSVAPVIVAAGAAGITVAFVEDHGYRGNRQQSLSRGEYEARASELHGRGRLFLRGRAALESPVACTVECRGALWLMGSVAVAVDVRMARLRRDDRELEELLLLDAA